jgi:hypothetical protein
MFIRTHRSYVYLAKMALKKNLAEIQVLISSLLKLFLIFLKTEKCYCNGRNLTEWFGKADHCLWKAPKQEKKARVIGTLK